MELVTKKRLCLVGGRANESLAANIANVSAIFGADNRS